MWGSRFRELVENVEVALVGDLTNHTRLLEEVVVDVRSDGLTLGVEVDFEIFSESRRVVVSQRLCVSERFEQWICGQHHVHHLLNRRVLASRDICDVLHESLRSFCLSCSGFTGDNDALVLLVGVHVVVGRFGDCEDVRRHLFVSDMCRHSRVCAVPPACSCPCSFPGPVRYRCPLPTVSISPPSIHATTYSLEMD